jgi:hypothetical protein
MSNEQEHQNAAHAFRSRFCNRVSERKHQGQPHGRLDLGKHYRRLAGRGSRVVVVVMISTQHMSPEDFVSTIPAEACTELGFEDEGPDRGMQMLSGLLLLIPVAVALIALLF